MLFPLSLLLDAATPWLPEALLASPVRARIQRLAARLPAAFGWAVLEHRLRPGDDRVDFLVCSAAQDGGRERLAALDRAQAARAGLSTALSFLKAWGSGESALRRDIPLVWLEYDLPPEREPEPLVFPCLDPSFPTAALAASPSPAGARALAERALSLLLGAPPDQAVMDAIERCAGLLPEGGQLLSVCAMPQRGTRDLRLYAGLPARAVPGWLRAIGWPGDLRQAEAVLELLRAGGAPIGIHVDIGARVAPYFSAERYLRLRPGERARGRELVDDLVRMGACDRDKGEAALRWLGAATVDPPGAEWLVHLQRRVSFKLIPRDGGVEAKAYLGFRGDFTLL